MVKTRVGYEANPNGNLWLKDTTGFGQKMLAKMGWKAGEGLGRDQQGIKTAIRVSRKKDNRGVGCTRQWAEEGSAQLDAFAAVLANLNKQHGASPAEEAESGEAAMGLEEISRRSRHRLHYAKFTRGKDLSACSDQALLAIIGHGRETEKEPEEVGKAKDEEEEEEEEEKKELGLRQVQSSLSTVDYFQQKMAAMRARLQTSASAPQLCESRERNEEEAEGEWRAPSPEESCSPARPTFCLGGDASDGHEDGERASADARTAAERAEEEEDEARRERKRRREERRRLRRERRERRLAEAEQEGEPEVEAEPEKGGKPEVEHAEDVSVAAAEEEEKETREERRRRKKERKRRKEVEEETASSGSEPKRKKKKKRKDEAEVEEVPTRTDDVSEGKAERKKRKKERTKPSSAAAAVMSSSELAEFSTENAEVLRQMDWSSFATSNLSSVVGYKYAKVTGRSYAPYPEDAAK